MNKNSITQKDYLLFFIAICLLITYIMLYPQLFPSASLKLPLTESQITQKAADYLNQHGYDTSGFVFHAKLYQNLKQLRYLQNEFGLKICNEIIEQNIIPVYFWKVRLKDEKSESDDIQISFDSDEEAKSAVKKAMSDTIAVNLFTDGSLIDFNIKIDQKINNDSLSYKDALIFAESCLKKNKLREFSKYKLISLENNIKASNNSFQFSWENTKLVFNEQETIDIEIHNRIITKYKVNFKPPKEIKKSSKNEQFEGISAAILFIAIFIFFIILLIQKLKGDQLDLKSNIGLGVLVSLTYIFMLYANIDSSGEKKLLTFVLPLVITTPFVFMSFIGVSSIAESEARQAWAEKVFTFDAFKRRQILFPQFSRAIFRGLALAFIAAGIIAILLKIATWKYSFFMDFDDSNIYDKFSLFPLLFIISVGFLNISFGEFIFRFFFISWLRNKIQSLIIIIIISSLLWVFTFGGYLNLKLSILTLNYFINFLMAIIFILFFLKTDFITVYWGAFSYYLIRELYPFTFYDHGFFMYNGLSLWLIFGCSIIFAIIGLKKKPKQEQMQQFVPDYIKRQKERDRITRELEIARSVQLSFLPREKPKLKGIDVASICLPATEVGGDYFDFIEIDSSRMGIVIGDVSGKGISAAFHMTLTKGFLKSQARSGLTPRDVLINLNELFYENVERGTFISMIYGIFDVSSNKFTFSRAGHNPLLVKKGMTNKFEILCPKGMALGLEKGEIFNQLIEEYTFGIHPKDVFMFYTDGFSEAMDNNKDEFGEERLQKLLNESHSLSSENIISQVKSQVFDFVGQAPQHDDMTMIVLKVL